MLAFPMLVFFLKFNMHQAMGTSTARMIFSAVGGAISYRVNGLGVDGLPPYSTGYRNWIQWLLLPGKQLKTLFVVVMFHMGLKMTGVFACPHLPL